METSLFTVSGLAVEPAGLDQGYVRPSPPDGRSAPMPADSSLEAVSPDANVPDSGNQCSAGDAGQPSPFWSGALFVTAITVDANYVYWTSVDDSEGSLWRCVKGPCCPSPTLLAQRQIGQFVGIAEDDASLSWTVGYSAVDDAGVPSDGGLVMRLLFDSGSPEVLASRASRLDRIAVQGSHVFWSEDDGGPRGRADVWARRRATEAERNACVSVCRVATALRRAP